MPNPNIGKRAEAGRGRDEMKTRTDLLTFGVFIVAVLGALGLLLRHGGVHGQSAALAIALLVILLVRVGIFIWNLRRQRAELERR